MRKIKIKLPFSSEDIQERHDRLMHMAQSLIPKDNFFFIIEEKHFKHLSYMIVLTTKKDLKKLAKLN